MTKNLKCTLLLREQCGHDSRLKGSSPYASETSFINDNATECVHIGLSVNDFIPDP